MKNKEIARKKIMGLEIEIKVETIIKTGESKIFENWMQREN